MYIYNRHGSYQGKEVYSLFFSLPLCGCVTNGCNHNRYESRKDTYCISTGTSHPQTNPPTQPPPPSTIITTTTSSSTAAIGGGVGGGDREEGGAVTDDTDTVETDQSMVLPTL